MQRVRRRIMRRPSRWWTLAAAIGVAAGASLWQSAGVQPLLAQQPDFDGSVHLICPPGRRMPARVMAARCAASVRMFVTSTAVRRASPSIKPGSGSPMMGERISPVTLPRVSAG